MGLDENCQRMSLRDVVFNYPAIDNHAHPLLKEEHRRSTPFEGAIEEAQPNAIEDAIHSLPGYRTTRQLAELYGLDPDVDWEEVKSHRGTQTAMRHEYESAVGWRVAGSIT